MSDGQHLPASDGVIADLLRDGDDYGLSRFYAAHAGSVHAYARRLVGPTAADDAMAGALATAVARVRAGDSSPLSHLVEDAIRQETLTRVRDVEEESSPRWRRRPQPECQRTPALLAARAAGRLSAEESENLQRHLDSCASCRELARRAGEAEQAFTQATAAPIGAAQDAALAAMAEEAGGDIPQPVAPPPIDIAAVAVQPEPEPASVVEPVAAEPEPAPEPVPAEPELVAAEPTEPEPSAPEPAEPEPVAAEPAEPEPAAAEPAAAAQAAAVAAEPAERRARRGGVIARMGATLRRLNAPPVPPQPQAAAETVLTPNPTGASVVEPVADPPVVPVPISAESAPEPVAATEAEDDPKRLAFVRFRRGRPAEAAAEPPVVPVPVAPEPEPVAAEPEPVAPEPELPVAAAVPTPEPAPPAAPEGADEPTPEPARQRWGGRAARRRERREVPAAGVWRPGDLVPRSSAPPEPVPPDRWARGTRQRVAAQPSTPEDAEWAKGAARGAGAGLVLERGERAPLRTRRHPSASARIAALLAFVVAAGAVAAYAAGVFDTTSETDDVAAPSTLTTPVATTTTPSPAAERTTPEKATSSKPSTTEATPPAQTTPAAPVAQTPVTPTRTVAQRPTTTTPTRTTPRRQTSSGTGGQQDAGSTRPSTPSDEQRRQPPPG